MRSTVVVLSGLKAIAAHLEDFCRAHGHAVTVSIWDVSKWAGRAISPLPVKRSFKTVGASKGAVSAFAEEVEVWAVRWIMRRP